MFFQTNKEMMMMGEGCRYTGYWCVTVLLYYYTMVYWGITVLLYTNYYHGQTFNMDQKYSVRHPIYDVKGILRIYFLYPRHHDLHLGISPRKLQRPDFRATKGVYHGMDFRTERNWGNGVFE